MRVRKPSWVDQFYPGDPERARRMWEEFFAECKSPKISSDIRAIQVPHAGWVYSGQAAAEAYQQIEGGEYSSVVMIGPQHRVPAAHIQVYPDGVWKSPLGNLEVDGELAKRFSDSNDAFKLDEASHKPEHSLEVQIPPLAMVAPDIKIVPILTTAFVKEHISILARSLEEIVGNNDSILVLVSSDLYHGESYAACKESDARTIELLGKLDADGLSKAFRAGSAAACGADGLIAILEAKDGLGITKAHHLASYNSNDATGMRGGYVVGYSAFAFT
ncbi:AmmeMemoRadiSam system protein B [candidate division WOR-3 bacterium]|uniref:AmmeMemoRadiSam system protein B n=1 Tax=candidate division WOR-3 bacterium TaxID=2052148 RepID=A0A9D5K7X4_UNCW3|nr:AmmeMemoRadiSam system protein B [candidate division WOR-3 bacterium]MBD3363947.1 AmmeMemoRadiSam system protein B [candidate division WOR-3 bacterium]